jgi:hypothetical protein
MEIWKKIKGYEDRYLISNYGNVMSLNYLNRGYEKILKPLPSGIGYFRVGLFKDKKCKEHYIHRLVALHFISEIKEGYSVNHIDSDKSNNKIQNLEIVTNRENTCHKFINKNKISRYIGVSFNKNANKFISAIKINGIRKHLGYFNDELSAYQARLNAEKYYGIENKYKIVF